MLRGNIKLIAISGKAGSGKSTLARALVGQFGYRKYSFAEPIYRMLNTLPYLEHLHGAMDRADKETGIKFYGKSPRELLQTLGTDWGRNCVHSDVWVRILEDKLQSKYAVTRHSSFLIDDLRFPNEAEWVRSVGGLIVSLERNGAPRIKQHVSELGFPLLETDIIVSNNGTIEELCQQATRIDDLADRRRIAMQSRAA